MALRSPEREVVPSVLDAADLAAGDEALFDPGDFGNGVRFAGLTDAARHREDEEEFHRLYLDVLAGRRGWGDAALHRCAANLGLLRERTHDRRPPRVAEREVPDRVLADIAEDNSPDLRLFAERMSGDDAFPSVGVLAALAFVGCAHDGRRPLDFWTDTTRERALARSAIVIERSPPCLYADGVPLLPLAARLAPEGPAPAGVYVARAYRVGEAWAWSGRMDLPARPEVDVIVRRLDLELLRIRRHERRSSWEDLLRRRPELVYRACAEGARRTMHDGGLAPP